MTDPLLSVVIPAYNEGHRLRSTLDQIRSYLASSNLAAEIILVDDGSRDRTSEMIQAYQPTPEKEAEVRFLHNGQNKGKGYSVRRGMLAARGSYALLTDADLSAPIQEMPVLRREVMEGSRQIAIGSRGLKESKIEVHQSLFRESGGKVFNHVVRLLTGLPFRDTQCGFKLFEMSRCKDIFKKQRIDGFGFDVEVLYIARKWGLSIGEVPVLWRHSADTKMKLFPDASRMLLDLLRIRLNDRKGLYDH